jgi:phage/conjugal plasmid C-4 type zinc finger TraR family protein
MDLVDQAQRVEIMHREAALAGHRERSLSVACFSHCAGCGAQIPDERRRALPGAETCVECQTLIERRSRFGGR